MNRRDFLKIASLTPFAGMMPELLSANSNVNANGKIVVLVELRGGNDALNTLIPFGHDEYYNLRPKLAIKENNLFKLNHSMGMNKSLAPLLPYWEQGNLAWVQGLGYQNPNRSHSRSREIWTTASPIRHDKEGWVEKVFTDNNKINGVSISEALGPLAGKGTRNLRIGSPESFLRRAERMNKNVQTSSNSALNHVLNTEQEIIRSLKELPDDDDLKRTANINRYFQNKGSLGQKLASVARLIISDMTIPAYKVGLDGFDTHSQQKGKHEGLLSILADNLNTFARTMKQAGKWQDIVVVTYSEFGRKAQENSSGGTDHGLAAAHLVMGGSVKGRQIYGKTPSLSKLDAGSVQYTEDFRSVYATLAQRWWNKSSPWSQSQIPFV